MLTKTQFCPRTPSSECRVRAVSYLAILSLSLASCASGHGSHHPRQQNDGLANSRLAPSVPLDAIGLRGEAPSHPDTGYPSEFLDAESGRSDPRPASSPGGRINLEPAPHLERLAFVRQVLASNPSIEAARQSWRAALAEDPQATALPDPTIEYSLAPLSIGSSNVPYGQIVGISQRFPWPGTLALKGKVAIAEAEAARQDYESTRQNLALMASILFDHYRAVSRSLGLNDEHLRLVIDIKAAAEAQYEAGRASQQEPLQAEVEHSHVIHQRIALESRQAVIIAQMNGLLHRSPEQPLPPPAAWTEPAIPDLQASAALQRQALHDSSELLASRALVRAGESAVVLAKRRSYPDFGVKTTYNSLWSESDNHWMIGFSLEVPIQLGARNAATSQARARLAGARARLEAVDDAIRVGVERARQQLIEAGHVVRLYDERLLPAVRAQIEAAQIGYETGRNGFQALIDAERSLRTLEIEHQNAIATYGQRSAELERALGATPGLPQQGGDTP